MYLILDEYSNVLLDSKALPFRNNIEALQSIMLTKGDVFYNQKEMVDIEEPGAVPIIVCGNTDVGKSMLVNEVLGAEVIRPAFH